MSINTHLATLSNQSNRTLIKGSLTVWFQPSKLSLHRHEISKRNPVPPRYQGSLRSPPALTLRPIGDNGD
jgi:hypothetical protein